MASLAINQMIHDLDLPYKVYFAIGRDYRWTGEYVVVAGGAIRVQVGTLGLAADIVKEDQRRKDAANNLR